MGAGVLLRASLLWCYAHYAATGSTLSSLMGSEAAGQFLAAATVAIWELHLHMDTHDRVRDS
jgi:hypothetical protein